MRSPDRTCVIYDCDHNAEKTHCPQGHPYDAENTRVYDGRRFCQACLRAEAVGMTDAEIAAMTPEQLAEEGIAPEVALAARMAGCREGWAVTGHAYDLGAVQAYADALAILRAATNKAAS